MSAKDDKIVNFFKSPSRQRLSIFLGRNILEN